MYFCIVFVLFLLSDSEAFPNQGRSQQLQVAPRIIGGNETSPGEIPWQAAIFITTPSSVRFCGGTLISTRLVLTAAHCTLEASNYTIQLGSNLLEGDDPNRVTVGSRRVYVNPDFTPDPLNHDLAIIELEEDVPVNDFINPIRLDRTDYTWSTSSLSATISGWGKTSDLNDSNNNVLKVARVLTASLIECTFDGEVEAETNICTSGPRNRPANAPCIGDSGGALVHDNLLIGVISYINISGCNSGGYSGNVRISSHMQWIRGICDRC